MEQLKSKLEKKIKEGCNQTFHFIKDVENELEVAHLISAFANSNDGFLLVGVQENGKIVGSFPMQVKEDVDLICSKLLIGRVDFKLEEVKIGRHIITQFSLLKNDSKISVINKVEKEFYVRVNSVTLLANKIILKVWFFERYSTVVEINNEHHVLLRIFDQQKSISLSHLYKESKLKKRTVDKLVSELLYLKLVQIIFYNNHIEYLLS